MRKCFFLVICSFLLCAANSPLVTPPKGMTPSDSSVSSDLSTVMTPQKRQLLRSSVCSVFVTPTVSAYGELSPWTGTGFVCDKKRGLICTNHHVVGQGAVMAAYDVQFVDGQKLEARLLYADPWHDFAFLEIVHPKRIGPQIHELSQFKDPQVGDLLFMAGNNQARSFSFQVGRVSDLYGQSFFLPEPCFGFLMNAVGGSSGSPLVDKDLKLVGIQFGGANDGRNYGIYGACLRDALRSLQKNKPPPRQHFGGVVYLSSLQSKMNVDRFPKTVAKQYLKDFPQASFRILAIQGILPGSPAEGILKPGDVIISIDDQAVGPSLYKLEKMLNEARTSFVRVGLYRDGTFLEKKVGLYNLHDMVIRKLSLFAGGTFFEANDAMRWQFGVQPHQVMLRNILPGSPFAALHENAPSDSVIAIHTRNLDTFNKITHTWNQKFRFKLDFSALTPVSAQWGNVFYMNPRQPRTLVISCGGSQESLLKTLTFSFEKRQWLSHAPLCLGLSR